MLAFSFSASPCLRALSLSPSTGQNPSFFFFPTPIQTVNTSSKPILLCKFLPKSSSSSNSSPVDEPVAESESEDSLAESISEVEIEIEIEKTGRNSRRIRSWVGIDAGLETVWNLLTDYERLADFIPGLSLSQLLEKGENFAKVFQIGQQNLAFGLKFDAKGILDCYEKDLEHLPYGRRQDIEFKMVEGDFKTFEGKWSILESDEEKCKDGEYSEDVDQDFRTFLSYIVDVEPKLWLPVHLVEGRLCKAIKVNLLSIREEARRATVDALSSC